MREDLKKNLGEICNKKNWKIFGEFGRNSLKCILHTLEEYLEKSLYHFLQEFLKIILSHINLEEFLEDLPHESLKDFLVEFLEKCLKNYLETFSWRLLQYFCLGLSLGITSEDFFPEIVPKNYRFPGFFWGISSTNIGRILECVELATKILKSSEET